MPDTALAKPPEPSPPQAFEIATNAVKRWVDSQVVALERARVRRRVRIAAKIQQVTNAAEYKAAVEAIRGMREAKKTTIEFFAPFKKPANAIHKALTSAEKSIASLIDDDDRRLTRIAGDWKREQQRIAEEAQREAERQARVAEAAAREAAREAERENAEQPELEPVQPAEEPPPPPPPPIITPPPVPKVAGMSETTRYAAEIEDLKLLAAAIAEGDTPIQAMLGIVEVAEETDSGQRIFWQCPYLNGQAKHFREALKIPGVKVVRKVSSSFR